MGDGWVVYVVGCLGFGFLDWFSRMRMSEDVKSGCDYGHYDYCLVRLVILMLN